MEPMRTLPPEVARERAERAARALAEDPRVRLVFFFGSAADPERTLPVRDVDLAVLTHEPLDFDGLLDLHDKAGRAAGGEVDLVPLNRAGVVLAREVADTGRCLYAESPELETDWICRTQMQYLDFKWYLDKQWELTGQRLEKRLDGPSR